MRNCVKVKTFFARSISISHIYIEYKRDSFVLLLIFSLSEQEIKRNLKRRLKKEIKEYSESSINKDITKHIMIAKFSFQTVFESCTFG